MRTGSHLNMPTNTDHNHSSNLGINSSSSSSSNQCINSSNLHIKDHNIPDLREFGEETDRADENREEESGDKLKHGEKDTASASTSRVGSPPPPVLVASDMFEPDVVERALSPREMSDYPTTENHANIEKDGIKVSEFAISFEKPLRINRIQSFSSMVLMLSLVNPRNRNSTFLVLCEAHHPRRMHHHEKIQTRPLL
jgi:hypothetical protein